MLLDLFHYYSHYKCVVQDTEKKKNYAYFTHCVW